MYDYVRLEPHYHLLHSSSSTPQTDTQVSPYSKDFEPPEWKHYRETFTTFKTSQLPLEIPFTQSSIGKYTYPSLYFG